MEKEKIPFKDYLISMLGKKKAREILSMTSAEKKCKIIIIDGIQGPTGKSTLATVLKKHGYLVLEQWECKKIELNDMLQHQTVKFSDCVE